MEPRLAAVRHGRHHMLFDRHRSRLALLAEAAGRLVGAHDARQLVRDLFDLIAARLRLDAVVNYDLVENAGDHGSWLQRSRDQMTGSRQSCGRPASMTSPAFRPRCELAQSACLALADRK